MLQNFKIDKKLLKDLDWIIILTAVVIMLFSCINIYSATYSTGGDNAKLQFLWLLVGLAVTYVILLFDYNYIGNFAYIIYGMSIVMLIVNKVLGAETNGANAWIMIGNRAIQPAEFAKIAIIILLARKLNDMEGEINNPKNFFIILFLTIIPTGLIVIQPDMGMTMVIFFTALGIVFIAGLDIKVILGGLGSILAAIIIIWNSGLIKDYQQKRITALLDPTTDLLGSGYQLWQSLIGIGSGGILGKGFLKGTQISGGFIPEAHTDFISAVVGEEWGLVGYAFLFTLYAILIYRCIKVSKNSKDIFGNIMVIGFTSGWVFSILQNAGMCVGIMPITGITLPFMSYGGSSTLTNFISLGLILNVGMRRKKLNF
ncbi:rod shape-determining protein RodA [Clostridium cellulovorans]|uniref:Peptidoglycan glycosyltransferase RodA n=1 Tax=Clostridium cellulovorans (strain ATCC 35296 / DSM 3052 / OCM 3 / 743B) TaxID=573061 RepID=D9SS08_CLOC7|nr:rod shape-determining protein RodA [Clostridium cellulovorans]ADL52455.1 rod shape-determining protein RodA [Clostridium cellulovorans 743B]